MPRSVHPVKKKSKYNSEFSGFYIPLREVSSSKLNMHLVKEIIEGT